MTAPTREDLEALVAEGLTLSEMGERLGGLSKFAVRRRLAAAGLQAPRGRGGAQPGAGRPTAVSRTYVQELVRLAEKKGWTQAEAALWAGVHQRTLCKWLTRHEVQWYR